MIAWRFCVAVSFGLIATGAVAAPCVSGTFDLPLPGATNVVSHVSDVPSAQFPAFWQQGQIDDFVYTIFASAEGTLRPTDADQDWRITLRCSVADQSCDFATAGAPPRDAEIVARSIGQCLLGAQMAPVAAETAGPVDATGTSDTARTAAIAGPSVCPAAASKEASDVAILQRLLTSAGQDPGEIDGVLGPKSYAAIEAFAVGASTNRTVPQIITLLETQLCGASAD
ncbi:peptidoglycan-binding domain-containing protein [Yoonia vestfoldensis]|uniref:peptidoglycan-binding domain-containing protein n=1 Tax=Yoonia vestfoldensis TaxID=245188 RepID=UPI00036E8EA1|nr:peptidoglycan-binding protein [Yoonia vestfoldensis]